MRHPRAPPHPAATGYLAFAASGRRGCARRSDKANLRLADEVYPLAPSASRPANEPSRGQHRARACRNHQFLISDASFRFNAADARLA